jgi:threonyl-tRNA synthetase
MWLAPVQVAVLPISEKFNDYAHKVRQALIDASLRAELNLGAEKIGAKIRTATLEKIPYQLILGDKEVQAGTVAVRTESGQQEVMGLDEFVARCRQQDQTRSL